MKVIVPFGGGTNSTAVLVGLHERNERPDLILFADTGGEKPHTYTHIEQVSTWCVKVGFPPVEIVRGAKYWTPQMVKDGSLEGQCIRLGSMPSKAFGYGQCSLKWKVEPQDKRVAEYCKEVGIRLADTVRLVGFDADEEHRAARSRAVVEKYPERGGVRYPLIEWDWDRDDCVSAIKRAGLTQPGKSACFYCPSSTKSEIAELGVVYPDLLARALEMERRARAGEGQAGVARCGLGRGLVWNDYVKALRQGPAQASLFSDHGIPEVDCGCYD
jgi:hypothetical protein